MIIDSMDVEAMALAQRATLHAALADPGRLAIVDRLLLADSSPAELRATVAMSSNLMAHHLKVLRDAGLIERSLSEGDRRRVYMRLNVHTLEAMVPAASRTAARILFVCTRNTARSQMAAAIWNRWSAVPAASAGTCPADHIPAAALSAAERHGVSIKPSAPRHIDAVLSAGDLVVAVCDHAHEAMPSDSGRLHWSISDPATHRSPNAFDAAFEDLRERIARLVPNLQPA